MEHALSTLRRSVVTALGFVALGCSGDFEDAGMRPESGPMNPPNTGTMAGTSSVRQNTAGMGATAASGAPSQAPNSAGAGGLAGAGGASAGAPVTAGIGASAGANIAGSGGGAVPDPMEPDPAEPDPVEPDPVEPDPVEPDPVEPDPVEPAECTDEPPPMPPADFQSTIDITWTEMTGGYQGTQGARSANRSIADRTTMILDKMMDNGGSLSYCVRYGSNVTVSAEQRDAVEAALERTINAWFEKLVGYDCFPYGAIPVSVAGWAVESRDTLGWEDGVVPIYVGPAGGGAGDFPPCDSACSWQRGRQSNYSDCEGGYENHYDLELWLEEGLGNTGFGEDFGQHLDRAGFMGSLDRDYHILLHEMGHGFGFPDYYDWDSWGQGEPSPDSVMVAGRAIVVTEWDGWMIRRLWSELRDRYL